MLGHYQTDATLNAGNYPLLHPGAYVNVSINDGFAICRCNLNSLRHKIQFLIVPGIDCSSMVHPLGAALREHPDRVDAAAVRNVISAYAAPEGMLMPAAVWIV